MKFQLPQRFDHVVDLLPAYINGTLDDASSEHVYDHLLRCEPCQLELRTWESIHDATHVIVEATPLPSVSVLDNVLLKIDAQAEAIGRDEQASRWSVYGVALHLWLVFKRQLPLISRSIWSASALAMTFGCVLALLTVHRAETASSILALFASVVGAAGVAFIYGAQNDAGFEITLSTPTSLRLVMLSRMVLVVGYNILLATIASAVVAYVHGGILGELIHLWLGPLFLLASISLFLSLMLGSTFAMLGTIVLEITQTVQVNMGRGDLAFVHSSFWQTNFILLLLAVLFIVFAVLYAPRQPRLGPVKK